MPSCEDEQFCGLRPEKSRRSGRLFPVKGLAHQVYLRLEIKSKTAHATKSMATDCTNKVYSATGHLQSSCVTGGRRCLRTNNCTISSCKLGQEPADIFAALRDAQVLRVLAYIRLVGMSIEPKEVPMNHGRWEP
jgi:hypothetical protein